MWWKGNDVYGWVCVIEGDYGFGDKLVVNICVGWILGVFFCGLGLLIDINKGYCIVNEGFKLIVGVDVVWGLSVLDVWVIFKEIIEL